MKNQSIKTEPDGLISFSLRGVNPLKPPGNEHDLQNEFVQYSTKHPGVTWHEMIEYAHAMRWDVFDLNELTKNKSLIKLSCHGKTADTYSLIPPPAAGSDAGPPTSGHRAGTSDLDVVIECLRKNPRHSINIASGTGSDFDCMLQTERAENSHGIGN